MRRREGLAGLLRQCANQNLRPPQARFGTPCLWGSLLSVIRRSHEHLKTHQTFGFGAGLKLGSMIRVAASLASFLAVCALTSFFSLAVSAQQTRPVVVQPGAPGQPTKVLPPSTRASLPHGSPKDVEFMQGMIMHHAQAVEMTALIEGRTKNNNIQLMGTRISRSQADEMLMVKRWLEQRGEQTSHSSAMPGETHSGHQDPSNVGTHNKTSETGIHNGHLMPGMLSAGQMRALERSKGAEFDKLFLQGMIQHHNGALIMVKDLLGTAGAAQDAELFIFATDVDSGQRAEISSMQTLLSQLP